MRLLSAAITLLVVCLGLTAGKPQICSEPAAWLVRADNHTARADDPSEPAAAGAPALSSPMQQSAGSVSLVAMVNAS